MSAAYLAELCKLQVVVLTSWEVLERQAKAKAPAQCPHCPLAKCTERLGVHVVTQSSTSRQKQIGWLTQGITCLQRLVRASMGCSEDDGAAMLWQRMCWAAAQPMCDVAG